MYGFPLEMLPMMCQSWTVRPVFTVCVCLREAVNHHTGRQVPFADG